MMPGLSIDNNIFPDRKDLKKVVKENNAIYDDIVEQAKKINLDKVEYAGEDFVPRSEVKQKQKVYFWIRVYLKEEIEMTPDTDVSIVWNETGEKLTTKFICYSKKGLDKDLDEQVTNYNPEDDKKVLCLMIDEDRININNKDIPFLKTLFKIGRFYEKQVWRKVDMSLIDGNGNELPWFDIDF
jgi:hypothetical protein